MRSGFHRGLRAQKVDAFFEILDQIFPFNVFVEFGVVEPVRVIIADAVFDAGFAQGQDVQPGLFEGRAEFVKDRRDLSVDGEIAGNRFARAVRAGARDHDDGRRFR